MLFVELYTPENLQLTIIITKIFLLRDPNHLLLITKKKKKKDILFTVAYLVLCSTGMTDRMQRKDGKVICIKSGCELCSVVMCCIVGDN